MVTHSSTTTRKGPRLAGARRPLALLLVDAPSQVSEALASAGTPEGRELSVERVETAAQARQSLDAGRYDVLVVRAELTDGTGLGVVAHAGQLKRRPQCVLIADDPTAEQTLAAMRTGVADVLPGSPDRACAEACLRRVLDRLQADRANSDRVRRLRKLCKKLNEARIEVSQQVDVLCSDLVTAYQELAVQMQHMVQSTEYGTVIREELDLEQLLRKTLEHVVEKSGATNAAIYLPSSADEFSVGGYVNVNPDAGEGASDILLDQIADRIPATMQGVEELVHLTDDDAIADWMGADECFLEGNELLAVPCRAEEETLSVLVLFRDRTMPYDERVLETVEAIAPLLGEALAKVIRVHHRHVADDYYEGEDDGDTLSF
ncbi:GAF domain-containing protein [Mucisphaera calidilacus]|uniref:Response regulatory domain-containing protein n=1 Tax=Mucisphaera calidilacus TaxID=2527982 RepID=A0A518BT87_9BACT|nr:GAF domain-containing protein [Mucisphaera calidilacus]QDU70184.1 hypothetical protein Pan265_00060 [Mucisphaera calidilacus]